MTTYENHTRKRKLVCGKKINIKNLKRSLQIKRIESDAMLRKKNAQREKQKNDSGIKLGHRDYLR